uniref:Serpin domain-containing protein n=1 Tax=Laticauda laticaudata TaxID=8630 RepID=A0A8C5WP28_LATLA
MFAYHATVLYHRLHVPSFCLQTRIFEIFPSAFGELEFQLTYEKFQDWTSSTSMENTGITIFLPKFKMEEEYSLIHTLNKMGMNDLFHEDKADLSGMSGYRDLAVSEVRHKAYIEVNEEGSKAGAATAVVVIFTSTSNPPQFQANRPFLLFIKHNSTKSILFAGKLSSP